MNAKNQNNVVELCKRETSTPVDMLRDLRRALSEAAAHVDLLPTAVEMLKGGVVETGAFDTLRDEAYGELIITMVAVAETHGVDLYPDKHQGKAFRRIAILEAEVAARAVMTVVLRGVNATAWDDHVRRGPQVLSGEEANSVGPNSEMRGQILQRALQTVEGDLADLRPALIRQLQPLAQLIAEHGIPNGMKTDRATHALAESAYRGMTQLVAEVSISHGLDVTKDKDAGEAFKAGLLSAAFSIADELLRGAGFQSLESASPYIN